MGGAAKGGAGRPLVAAADVAALPVRNIWLTVFGIMTASLLQILDSTIANVAIPHMQAALGATPDEVSWVLTSYIVATAVAIPATGWISDRVGSRRLFILSTFGFVLSSMLCGMAQNITQMVLFRCLQGITGAFIQPLSQAAMLDINPPSRQAQMMSIWGMGLMIGPILGPILGGWLTENLNWRWVFYVNVPLGVVALAILAAQLPSRPIQRRRFDLFGFGVIAVGITALQLLLDRGNHVDWYQSIEIWIYSLTILCTLWIGGVHFLTGKSQKLFHGSLFANRSFVAAFFFMAVIGMVMFASMALMPAMLQRLFGYSVMATGWAMMPRGVGTLISMYLAGQSMRRGYDPRLVVMTGFLLVGVSFWEMSAWSLAVDQPRVIVSGLVQGLGLGLLFMPLNNSAFATLMPSLRTEGSSLLNLSRSMGASVGIAITTGLLGRNWQASHADIGSHVTASMTSVMDFSTLDRFQQLGTAAMSFVDVQVNRQAAMIAYIDNYYLMMWLSLIAAPMVVAMRKPSANRLPPPPAEPPH